MLEQTELLLWCFETGCCSSWEPIHTAADMHPDQLPLSVMQTSLGLQALRDQSKFIIFKCRKQLLRWGCLAGS